VEERIRELEMQMGDLRVDNARLGVQVTHFTEVTTQLSKGVEELTDALNKIKGAFWVLGIVASGIGALFHWLTTQFGSHN
jgi:hypothetical protein